MAFNLGFPMSAHALSGVASSIFTLVRRVSFLAEANVPVQHCKLVVTAICQVMHLALSFGGPISIPLLAHLPACLQALARECKLPALLLQDVGGVSSLCSHGNISVGEREESSHRPSPSLRTIFWCPSITLCPWASSMREGDTSQAPPTIWVKHCMTGSRRLQLGMTSSLTAVPISLWSWMYCLGCISPRLRAWCHSSSPPAACPILILLSTKQVSGLVLSDHPRSVWSFLQKEFLAR